MVISENVLVLVLLATLFAGCGLWKGVGLNNTEAFPAETYAFVRVWNSAALTEDWKAAKTQSERLLSLGSYFGTHYYYSFTGVADPVTDRYIFTCHAGMLDMIHMATHWALVCSGRATVEDAVFISRIMAEPSQCMFPPPLIQIEH